jgi:hypothetical protein
MRKFETKHARFADFAQKPAALNQRFNTAGATLETTLL